MPLYRCEIIDSDGKKRKINLEALDEDNLKATVRLNQGYLVKSTVVKEKKANTFFAVSSKVKPVELVLFLRQFSVMISAGATISDSLDSLKKQRHSKAFTRVLQEIHDDVLAGVSLSEAFSKHPKVFPPYFQNMVAIGESSGSIEMVLESLADYYEHDRKIKTKAKTAMIYPVFLLIMIVVVIVGMSCFILPEFDKMFKELGGEVPTFTKVVLNISSFIKDNLIFLFLGCVVIGLILFLFFKSKNGKRILDNTMLHLPFIGKIQKELITYRFSSAFIILLSSGMNITDCMVNLKRMLGSEGLKRRFDFVISQISRGNGIAISLKTLNFFPDVLIDMISVGEQSGNLEQVLKSTSSYFNERVENAISRATLALEPIMIIILGVLVGTVILAVFIPIISLMQNI